MNLFLNNSKFFNIVLTRKNQERNYYAMGTWKFELTILNKIK